MKEKFYTELRIKVRIEEEKVEIGDHIERRFELELPDMEKRLICVVANSQEAEKYTDGLVVEKARGEAREKFQERLSVRVPTLELLGFLDRVSKAKE